MSGKVVIIGISEAHGSQIKNVNEVVAIKGKGLTNDRHFKENNLNKVFRVFGEENYAKKIAKKIVEQRNLKKLILKILWISLKV